MRYSFIFRTNLDEFWSVYQCEFSSSRELQVAAFQVPTSLVPLAAANGISEHFKIFKIFPPQKFGL
jgi:hypothetical protein